MNVRSRDSRILPATPYRLASASLSGGRRRRPGPVIAADADRAPPLARPVGVHLPDQQHRGPGAELEVVAFAGLRGPGPEPQLERAVGADLDGPVVERAQAVRHLDRGVIPL